MSTGGKVAIFWDYASCQPASNSSGYEVVNNIRSMSQNYGNVTLFKAYLESVAPPSPGSSSLRSELQSSGVSLTDCPHNGGRAVTDKMILADMLVYAIDNQAPATIILISGDRDFAYAVSILRLRNYCVVVVAPPIIHVSLKSQASVLVDWNNDILGNIGAHSESPKKPPSSADEGNSPQLSNESELDPIISPTRFPNSLPSRSAESVEDVERMGQNARVPAKGDNDSPQRGITSGFLMHGMSQKYPNVSGASVPDAKIQPSVHNATKGDSLSSINWSPFQKQPTEEPTVPTTAGGTSAAVRRSHTPLTSLISGSGQLDYTPGIFQQTHMVSGGNSSSTVRPGLEFGTGLPRRSSVFNSPSDQGDDAPGSRGSWNDGHLFSESSPMTSVSNTGSRYSGIVKPSSGSGLSCILSKTATAGRSHFESPENGLGGTDDISFRKTTSSKPSSAINSLFVTSTTAQTCPGSVKTPLSLLPSAAEYPAYRMTDANNAMPYQSSPKTLAKPQPIAKSSSVASATSSVGAKTHNDQNWALPTWAATKARGSAIGDSDETAAPLPLKNVIPEFRILIELLELQREKGVSRPLRSAIAEEIVKRDVLTYGRVGVDSFGQYIALALKAGIVITGRVKGKDWISLHPALQSPLSSLSSTVGLPFPQLSGNETDSATSTVLDPAAREHGAPFAVAESTSGTEVPYQPIAPESSPVETTSYIVAKNTSMSSRSFSTDGAPRPEINIAGPVRMVRHSDYLTDSKSFTLRSIPPEFEILVEELKKQRANGLCRPSRSSVAIELVKQDELVYRRAGVNRFKDYIALAVEAQVVIIGGAMGEAWISLPPDETPKLISRGIVPSPPSTSNVPRQFRMLIEQLQKSRSNGVDQPLRSLVGQLLLDHNKAVYKDAGFEGFKDYIAAAERAGIVQLGGVGGNAWISLCSV